MKLVLFSKYKKLIPTIFVYSLIFYLLAHSKILVTSISTSTNIFLTKLIPALFPYLLITEILINSGKITHLAFGLEYILSKLFHIPKNTASCVVVGFLLGYPNAAKCILKLYQNNDIDSNTATTLVSFTSNANMSYIIATVGIGIFNSIEVGIILAISHFLSAIIIGIIFPPSYNNSIIQQTKVISNSFEKIYTPFELLYISIGGTLKTLAYIFSYTVIFSLIPTVLLYDICMPETIKAVITGIFEISNGINNIAILNMQTNAKLVLISFILSFSSLMILIQIFSFVFKAHVKFTDLLKFKILQGIISSIITYITLKFIYTPALTAFSSQDLFNLNITILPSTAYMFAIVITIIFSLIFFEKQKQI